MATAQTELPAWETPASRGTNYNRANPFSNITTYFQQPFWSRKRVPVEGISVAGPAEKHQRDLDHSEEVQLRPGARRRYCGYRKRTCIFFGVMIVLLLALIIGLSVGLVRKGYVNLNTFHPHPF